MVAKARMQQEGEVVFCATRYGNVMASRGSAIPLFVSQLKEGTPLTVTDPNMTCFLMSLEDSVGLVLYAYEHENRATPLFRRRLPVPWPIWHNF